MVIEKYMHRIGCFLFFYFLTFTAYTQSIVYAPAASGSKSLKGFEVIGKSAGYYVISKIIAGKEYLSFYDAQMKEQKLVPLLIDKKRDQLVGFTGGATGIYVITSRVLNRQHYMLASFVNGENFSVGLPIILDSFPVNTGYSAPFRLLRSKSGEQTVLFKVNRSDRSKNLQLDLLFIASNSFHFRKLRLSFPSFAAQHKVEALELADNGNFYFVVSGRNRDAGYIQQLAFYELPVGSNSIRYQPVPIDEFYPERIQLFINNRQQNCTLFSFASATDKGNIDGVFTASIKMGSAGSVQTAVYKFSDKQRQQANNRISRDIAFNDFYITDAVSKSDGGLMVLAECMYTAARETNINRWERPLPDGWYNSAATPLNFSEQAQSNTVAYGALGANGNNTSALSTAYTGENFFHAENILVLDLDGDARVATVRFINKRQQSNVAYELSYAALKRTDGLFMFYNDWVFNGGRILRAVQVDSALSLAPLPVVRGLLPGYVLLNRLAVQVSNNELVIPAVLNNRFVFAALRF